MFDQIPSLESLETSLTDSSNPIGMRMRAAYYLRQLHTNNEKNETPDDTVRNDVIRVLSAALLEQEQGSLMRHEIAYVMGQIRDDLACNVLEQVLCDNNDNVMVRHEAAEALGAIGAQQSVTVLESVANASSSNVPVELAETCQVALDVYEWRSKGSKAEDMPAACACMLSPYSSVDPAPPHPAHADMPMEELGDVLCNAKLPLFERYRAMFSLRNRAGKDAVAQLCRALVNDTSSALLRHEVAYVLGQLQHVDSIDALETSLRRPNEHSMVRHESAEALGAIDSYERWTDIERILTEFAQDENDVIRESCLVALDGADYWGHNKSQNDESDSDEGEQISNAATNESSFTLQKNTPVLANHFNIAH